MCFRCINVDVILKLNNLGLSNIMINFEDLIFFKINLIVIKII